MSWFTEAITFLERSITDNGATAASAFALALAHYGRRDMDEARDWAGKALAIEPGFGPARTLLLALGSALDDGPA
jgi:hypothetical protein